MTVASDAIAHFLTLPELEHLECTLGVSPFKRREHAIIEAHCLRKLYLFTTHPPTIVFEFPLAPLCARPHGDDTGDEIRAIQ